MGLPSAAASIMTIRSAACMGSSRTKPPVPPSRHSTPGGSVCFSMARTTWTPTPSSAMRIFPSPRTNVFWGLFATLVLIALFALKLPSADDGRNRTTTLNVVVIQGEVNVDDDECDEEPQEQVMAEASLEFAGHQRNDRIERRGEARGGR